jgi:hypothetical protein
MSADGTPGLVAMVNQLTSRWSKELQAEQTTVLSGAGALGLLAALLALADGDARAELAAATGLEASGAGRVADELVRTLNASRGTSAGVGLWVGRELELDPGVGSLLREAVVDTIPADPAVLHAWASAATRGLIDTFPVAPTAETLLVVAAVLAADADWVDAFDEGMGHWASGAEWIGWLSRSCADLDQASLLKRDGVTVSRVVCETTASFDVHVVAGDATDSPGIVLGLAVDSLDGDAEVVVGSDLELGESGGCLVVEMSAAWEPEPRLTVTLPVFDIAAGHDLLAKAELFGLQAASDRTRGHFPGLAARPLAVEHATQSVVASFSSQGFRAGAVSVASMMAGAGMPPGSAQVVRVAFDRPFGFLVVDRSSRLVLFAGWVADPSQAA